MIVAAQWEHALFQKIGERDSESLRQRAPSLFSGELTAARVSCQGFWEQQCAFLNGNVDTFFTCFSWAAANMGSTGKRGDSFVRSCIKVPASLKK